MKTRSGSIWLLDILEQEMGRTEVKDQTTTWKYWMDFSDSSVVNKFCFVICLIYSSDFLNIYGKNKQN